jgi:hypothetical protein
LSPPASLGFVTVEALTLTLLAERFIDCARKNRHFGYWPRIGAGPITSASGDTVEKSLAERAKAH